MMSEPIIQFFFSFFTLQLSLLTRQTSGLSRHCLANEQKNFLYFFSFFIVTEKHREEVTRPTFKTRMKIYFAFFPFRRKETVLLLMFSSFSFRSLWRENIRRMSGINSFTNCMIVWVLNLKENEITSKMEQNNSKNVRTKMNAKRLIM